MKSATATHPEGRLPCISSLLDGRQVPNGRDRASPEAINRCHADGIRLPYRWYEDSCLLWRLQEDGLRWDWSIPSVEEIERFLGFDGSRRASARNVHQSCHRGPVGGFWPTHGACPCFALSHLPFFRAWAFRLAPPSVTVQPLHTSSSTTSGVILSRYFGAWKVWTSFVRGYTDCLPREISEVALPFLHLCDSPQSEFNSFTAYRATEGFPVTGLWRPDLREAELLAPMKANMGVQTGMHLRSDGLPRLVPEAASLLDHVSKALAVGDLPFDSVAPWRRHLSSPPGPSSRGATRLRRHAVAC